MKVILIFSLFLFSCQSSKISHSSQADLNAELVTRKIRLTPDKPNSDLVTLVVHKSSYVKNFSISDVCVNFKIKSLGIHSEEFDDLFFRNIRQCDWSNLEEVAISSKKVDLKLICSYFKQSKQIEKSLLIQNRRLDQDLFFCRSFETGITNLGLDEIQFNSEITFCDTLRNFSSIRLLSVLKAKEGKKELDCILELPNLNYLSLQNWKGASISDFRELVKKYETKYKRKLQADVEDPTSYER